jgi:hypothetical protein
VQSVDRDGHSSHSERRGGQQQRDVLGPPGVADDPRVSGIHGRSVSADDQPSPVNQSALSVNPVGYDLGNFNGDGEDGSAPFIYDRGTQTIHLAPQGARHDQIKRWAGSKIQGPIYQGWQDGYTIDYHHAPQRHEREAIEQALQKHTGLPLEDVNLYDNDDQFNLYSKRRRKLANKCAVCGDLLKGVDCPRCNWGGWDHAEDNTKNPSDPTVDMSLGIQSKTAADGLLPCPDCGGDVQKTNRYHHDTTQVPYQCSRCHRTFGWNEVQNHGLLQPQGPACPKCTQEMHFREPSSLGPLYPEGAWQCSNFDCYNVFPPGQLTPDTYEDPDNGSSGLTLPEHWGGRTADYQGWTNWDTWHTKLMMDNDYDLYQQQQQMAEHGWTPEQIRDWAVEHVLGPHNKQQIADAREWNEIPEEERTDPHYDEFVNKHPEAQDLIDGLTGGPDVSDTDPMLMDPELVNWHEIHKHIMDDHNEELEYEREQQRLQNQGLTFAMPGHTDETNQMLDAWLKHHGVTSEDQKLPNGAYAEHHMRMQVPIEHLPHDDGEWTDDTHQQWQQQGYGEPRVRSYGWSTLHDIQRGRANEWQTQRMQEALAGQGYQPEQVGQIMSQRWKWDPNATDSQGRRGVWIDLKAQPKQPDPSLDQPGDLTIPEDWGTFSRVIPPDRWRHSD